MEKIEEIIKQQREEFIDTENLCERCGGETATKLIGDESYDWCPDCNWMTN